MILSNENWQHKPVKYNYTVVASRYSDLITKLYIKKKKKRSVIINLFIFTPIY